MLENMLSNTTLPFALTGSIVGKILPNVGGYNFGFGVSVALSRDGKLLAVGQSTDSGGGSVHIFRSENGTEWAFSAKIVSTDLSVGDRFGECVVLSDNGLTCVVGAQTENAKGPSSGSAYVFRNTTGNIWVQTGKLISSDGQAGSYMGSPNSISLSSDGNTCLVGAYMQPYQQTGAGSVYVFQNTNDIWSQVAKLVPSSPTPYMYFGMSVSISADGNKCVVGARGAKINNISTGIAFVFIKNGAVWSQVAEISPNDPTLNSYFGQIVSVSSAGDVCLISAHGANANSGSVYVFRNTVSDTWAQVAKINQLGNKSGDSFGYSIALAKDGKTAIVGAPGSSINGTYSGAAYVFTNSSGDSWVQVESVIPSDGVAQAYVGNSVALSGDANVGAVGAYRDDDLGQYSGSVYVIN